MECGRKPLTMRATGRYMSTAEGGGEDVRERIARLTAEIDLAVQPDDLPGMILSGNAVRRCEHLEVSNRKQSELIAAYVEYTAHLEALIASALEVQSELTEVMRMQSDMIPSRPVRKAGAGGGRAASGRAKPAAKAKATAAKAKATAAKAKATAAARRRRR